MVPIHQGSVVTWLTVIQLDVLRINNSESLINWIT
jgi:hypothetical protein